MSGPVSTRRAFVMRSTPELRQVVQDHGFPDARGEKDERQAHGDLRDGDRDPEQDEDDARQEASRPCDRDDREIDRVGHQLDREQHADRVPPGQDAVEADGENGRRHEAQVGERHSGRSLRARRSAPKTAPSRRTDSSSNGTR